MRNLDEDFDMYDISVDNMVPMSKEHECAPFTLLETSFFNQKGEDTNMPILSDSCEQQIFRMKDGKFILEIDNGDTVDYFYSENLNDLIL